MSKKDVDKVSGDLSSNQDNNFVVSDGDIFDAEEIALRRKKKQIIIFSIIASILTIAGVLCLIFLPAALYKGGAKGGIKLEGTYTSIITIYLLAMLTAVVLFVSKYRDKKSVGEIFTTKNITRTAVFSAIAIVLYYYVKFPVPAIFPSFLDIQFSDLPALLAGFMMGPIPGIIVILIKFLVKLPASGTMCVGETVDLILGLAFIIPAAIIYRRKHNIKGAILALVIGSLCCTFAAALANRFIAVPAYLALMFNGNWTYLLKTMNVIFDGKVNEGNFYNYYIFLSVIPFNLLRCFITSLLTFLLYKSLKKVFDRISR